MNYNKKTVADIDVAGKKVLLRCDFNVPQDKDTGAITSDKRIVAALPTIRYLLEHGAAVIACSHLGKPEPVFDKWVKKQTEKGKDPAALTEEAWKKSLRKLTLAPVAERLSQLLGQPVIFAHDVVGEDAAAKAAALQPGQLLLLENTRFEKGETKNDPDFAKKLASLADIYVSDAFGAVHRAHASTAGVAAYLPAVSGFLIEKELRGMRAFLQTPSAARIALPSDPRGYDPNRIRVQFLFGERTQYLRYGYQLYLLNGETITAVAPDIRWVGGGSIGEALYAVGYETEQKQTEGSGTAALYQIDQTQATRLWTLPHGASIVCGGEDCLYLLADDTLCEYRDDQLLRLTQLLPLGIVSNEITGMTAAADGLRLLTQTGYYVLTEREASDTALPDAAPQNAALRVGYCNDETGTIQAVLAAFAAENPEITVTAETYASHDELLIKLISGDVPDVLWFHGELATLQSLAGKGLLRDLSGIAAELNQFDEYYGNLLACGTLGDALCVLFPAFSVEVFSVPDAILPESRKIETCRQFDDVFSPFCPDGYGWTTRGIVLNWFLNDSLSDFVNYDTMEANFQQQSFYEMLEFCKIVPFLLLPPICTSFPVFLICVS